MNKLSIKINNNSYDNNNNSKGRVHRWLGYF